MPKMTAQYEVNCKRCLKPIAYSAKRYEKMEEAGQSRPEYCEECRLALMKEKMTMGTAYVSMRTKPGEDLTEAIPGELGKVYHPDRPHIRKEMPETFDEKKFGATPQKIVEIYEWLKDKNHQVAIVIGETGSGKSTALPYWLINPPEGIPSDFFLKNGQILITQPRIVATTGISEYLAELLGSSLGKGFDVGYRYSGDRNADRYNAAFLATDGSLINMIMNGQLAELSVVMIDEAHERSKNIDIILRLLKDQLPLYPHLKLLIVSATINQDSFLKYFGTDTAKVIEFEAKRKFDYKTNFALDAEKLPYEDPNKLRRELVPALVKKVIWLLDEQVSGKKIKANTLAFLQGVKPIEEAVAVLRKEIAANTLLAGKVDVYPLYSDLNEKEQNLALKGNGSDKIRVIVSTNVAEASITVDGIVYVIETGVENQANWNSEALATKVGLNLISQANAKQRWGRSGRTAPGEVFCLYTKEQFGQMRPFPVPAIQRTSMDEVILLLKKLGVDDLEGGWIDEPTKEEVSRSTASLKKSGGLDDDGDLTDYGLLLQQFAYTATLTDLIVLSDRFGCSVEVATLLPVIKNGGQKYLLARSEDWDKETAMRAKKAHEFLAKGCKDDLEFILKLYSLWLLPPDHSENKKNRDVKSRRKEWCAEFFVNDEVFEEIAEERGQILSLLNEHKKNSAIRDINFKLLNRVRIILAYCLPYKEAGVEKYVYNARLIPEPGTSAAYQLSLAPEKQKILENNIDKTKSLFALARDMIGLAEDEEACANEGRIFADADLSLDEIIELLEKEQTDKILKEYAVGQMVEARVTAFTKYGTFVKLPLGNSGMIHISKMGKRVNQPQDMLTVGDRVMVEILEIVEEKEKVRIGLRLIEILKKS